MAQGYIPEKITFVYSDSAKRAGDVVVPAFVVDSTNPRTMETAENWASQGDWRNRNRKKDPEVKKMEMENAPFKGPIINDLEVRSEGGRAWKAVVSHDFYVDIRESELLWCIKNTGISPGGILNGEFVFGIAGSQMKVIPIKSPLFTELSKATKRKKAKKISNKALQDGHRYEMKNGSKWVFLGAVSTLDFSVQKDWARNCRNRQTTITKIRGKVKYGLWFEESEYGSKDDPADAVRQQRCGDFSLKKSTTAIIDHGPIPKNKLATVQQVQAIAESRWQNPTSIYNWEDLVRFRLMVPYGQKVVYDEKEIHEGKVFLA